MTGLRLFGWTRAPRVDVTHCLTDAVSRVGGFVLESQRFSNAALMLRVQMPASRVSEMANSIVGCQIHLDAESESGLLGPSAERDNYDSEMVCTIHLRFLHDDPDLRIETPAGPG